MQAALDQMNIKLHHVIDNLTGMTGLAIIEAILEGERDPHQLAKHRDRRSKTCPTNHRQSLGGRLAQRTPLCFKSGLGKLEAGSTPNPKM